MNARLRTNILVIAILATTVSQRLAFSDDPPIVDVEGQPLAANVNRVIGALEILGHPLPAEVVSELREAGNKRDADQLQKLIDAHVLLLVNINPESRVKVARGPAEAVLQQAGYTPVLVKIVNESTITKRLRIVSPQAGPVYGGVTELSMKRQQQEQLRSEQDASSAADRFLDVELFTSPPISPASLAAGPRSRAPRSRSGCRRSRRTAPPAGTSTKRAGCPGDKGRPSGAAQLVGSRL
jgi:hypothetical protein